MLRTGLPPDNVAVQSKSFHQFCFSRPPNFRTRDGHGAEMSGVLFDKVYLYHYCEMSGVFGTASDIGAATVCGTLRFDDGDTPHKIHGRYEVPTYGANATYMGEYCRTGVNAIIMPGRKIGSYSVVGAGVVLNEDVPSQTMITVKQELVKKPWGPSRYGW